MRLYNRYQGSKALEPLTHGKPRHCIHGNWVSLCCTRICPSFIFTYDGVVLIYAVAHIVRQALDLGLNLQTWTAVTSVTQSTEKPGQWVVSTSRGSIVTPTVIHATNAYAQALLPETNGIIRPTPHM